MAHDPSPVVVEAAARPTFEMVISDGSSTVRVGRRAVRFPGRVSDAVVSPNGTTLAYVDEDGNIAVARLDGSGVRALTAADPGVRRAQPTFEDGGSEIVFTERGRDGVWRLKEVAADGHDGLEAGRPDPTVLETTHDGGGDTAPSATWYHNDAAGSARSVLVYQHRTSKGALKVYVNDRNQRGFGAYALLPGRSPAVSPAGDALAFIAPDGQIEVQPWPMLTRRPHPVQVTWGAHPTGHLVWSLDGRRIIFSTQDDVESVARTAAPGAGRNPVRVEHRGRAVATMAALAEPAVRCFAGAPVVTAAAVSAASFVDGVDVPTDESSSVGVSWADHVTLLSATDESAAAPAAAIAHGGPILFVRDGRLDAQVQGEIARLLDRPRGWGRPTVDIVGSTSAVPDSVASQLRTMRLKVKRFDPQAAAEDAVRAARGQSLTYVVVSMTDLSALASSVGVTEPILLTDGATMPAETAAKLDRMPRDWGSPPTVYAVGSAAQGAVRSSWPGKKTFRIVDVGGADRDADSLAAVQGLYDAPGRLAVTTSTDWQDALIATMAGPALVLDPTQRLSPAVVAHLAAATPTMRGISVVGGPARLAGAVGRAVFGARFAVQRGPGEVDE